MSRSPRQNVAKAAAMTRDAAGRGAQVICLPELYRSRYFPRRKTARTGGLTETIPGESTEIFSQLARELEVVLIVPVYENDGGQLFNTACVIDADGSLLGKYRKIHIPHDPSFYEGSYFQSGDLGYPVFASRYLRFAALICYDQWVPEAARVVALKGADVIFYPSAIGHLKGDPLPPGDWRSAWETIQRSHAIANGVHVAALNRVGTEGEVAFWGGSFVCDAFGRMLEQASLDDESALVASIDVPKNEELQEGWGFRRNRHPESYAPLIEPVGDPTPRDLSLSMPAEWEPHFATWLAWPYDRDTFDNLPAVEDTYVRLIEALHHGERIELLVKNQLMKRRVKKLLQGRGIDLTRITIHEFDYADVWFRDYGPIFLANPSRTSASMVHWRFNAWGGKYESLLKDGCIPDRMHEYLQLPQFSPGIVLEGGSVDSNGSGTFLTTEQCLLNPNRNPELSRTDTEGYLGAYLGSRQFVWLAGGITGDDTDGHVDTVARFVGPRTVLCAYEEDSSDANHAVLAENYRRLCSATDQDGNRLDVVGLPLPSPINRARQPVDRETPVRLPATYLNFYFGNDVVVVPTFQDANDESALDVLRRTITDRRIVGIDCVALLHGYGALHCVTQQEPLAGQLR
ncbi:MAG TPA: agmatine deiminase family protein, partial [Dehalococcoidia bacterium]|nr:agmatine deiminase family protein [Dehalococcoidia bacterium]